MNGFDSLAVKMLKNGWIIWVGNNHGNIYSRFNTELGPKENPKEFIDYSFYEMA